MTIILSFLKNSAKKILWIFTPEELEYDGDHKTNAAEPAKEKFISYLLRKEDIECVPYEIKSPREGGFLKWLFQREML